MTGTVLILGASGKIGQHAQTEFWNAGWEVKTYTRGTDMAQAAKGCDVIVNGLNPPNYHNWAEIIPQITAQVIAAAKASGATVIIPGNVYNYGQVQGEIGEDTPQTPCSRKGEIRVEMEQAYRDAGVQTIVLRAGNFIDPDRNACVMSVLLLRDAAKGKITVPGDKDALQPYAYVPDWARAAVALAEKREWLSAFEDIPFPGHAFTLTDLKAQLEASTGRSYRFASFPWWVMSAASPVWELARELREMRYLWDMSHSLSAHKFSALLPDFQPTDLRTVMLSALPPEIHPDQSMGARGLNIAAE